MSTPKNVTIVGGHGKVALRLTQIIASTHIVTSIIRSPSHSSEVTAAGASPFLLSLEEASVAEISAAIQGADVVVFCAGSGGHGGPERFRTVDYGAAVKVFDAIDSMSEAARPRLILLSAIDVRDRSKTPAHYNEEDTKLSDGFWSAIGPYMLAKYDADKNLVARTGFKWTILRPALYQDEPGTGKASVGRTHVGPSISRDDVAQGLAVLVDRPDAAGLAIDFVGGDDAIEGALDATIKKGETDWLG